MGMGMAKMVGMGKAKMVEVAKEEREVMATVVVEGMAIEAKGRSHMVGSKGERTWKS